MGEALKPQEFAELAGAPPGSTVEVSPGTESQSIDIHVEHPYYATVHLCTAQPSTTFNGTILWNSNFALKEEYQRKGIGTRVLAAQVAKAQKLGVKGIGLIAGRGELIIPGTTKPLAEVGYYVCGKLGFDDDLPESILLKLPKEFKRVTTISDLLQKKGGLAWWQENGVEWTAWFDPHPDSQSIRTLKTFLKKHKIPVPFYG
jgi:GNAT superfamily N-acetyltransferase